VVQAQLHGIPYVYLGYWVQGSPKMDYKARFEPVEVLKNQSWVLLSARERKSGGGG
jgi:arginine-tRNA-protein transferase